MATQQNLKQTGWFYHAPSKPKPHHEQADLPAPSQIPGLSGDNMPYNPLEEPKKMLIKESDSAYVRLAKMGGRQDLLRNRTPVGGNKKEAKPYHRTDWYYLEDNRQEDEMEKERLHHDPYVSSLPDYMVHHDYKPHGEAAAEAHSKSRNPLSRDTSTVYQREGETATDKTVRIQENRPSGYGIRQEKQKDRKQKMPAVSLPERGKAPNGELEIHRPTARHVPKPQEEDRPLMSKILSFGYGRDDLDERQKWLEEQDAANKPTAHNNLPGSQKAADRTQQTEYQAQMHAQKKGKVPAHGRRAGSGQVSESGSVRSQQSQRSKFGRHKEPIDQERPDFFKLSKFNNVPAKVSSHRCAEEIEPMAYNPTRDLSDLHVTAQPVGYAAYAN